MNTILRDLSIIWILLHCCIMFMLLYESRYSRMKTNLITGIFMIPLIIVNMSSVLLLGIARAGELLVFTCVLPSLLFFFIMTRTRDTRFLFTFCLVDTVVLEVLFATNLLDTILDLGNYVVMFISRLLILPVLEFLIIKYVRKPYHILQQQTKKGWGIFSAMAALFYAVMLLVTYYPDFILDRQEYFPHLILILVLVPVMYATVFNVLWKQLALFRAADENRMLNMQIKMMNERFASSEETENRLKILRHDVKHQMLLLHDYLKSGRLDDAEDFIHSVLDEIDKNPLQHYSNNHSVNVVLSHYDKIARQKGFTFETDVRIPEKLHISETDFAVVLSNGIENAINALDGCDCDNRRLIVKSFTEDGKLYLEIKNPFSGSILFEDGLPKSNRENHGYGTKSMAAIVSNYNGIYSFIAENSFFVFRCAI